MMRFSGTIFLFFACLPTVVAQQWTFIPFGKGEGLRHTQVLDISQDPSGNLWLSTITRSIYRFDGHTFNEYKIELPDYNGTLYAYKAVSDRKGRVWVLSNLGLILFDGKTSGLVPGACAPTINIWSELFVDINETAWLIDAKGMVYNMRDDSLVYREDIHEKLPQVHGYFMSKDRMPTFYSRSGTLLSIAREGNAIMPQEHWQSVKDVHYIARVGDTVLVSSSAGIDKFTPSGTIHIDFPDIKPMDMIHSLTIDRHGYIWGIMAGRVFVINRANELIWLRDEGAIKNDAFCVFRDKQGSVWLGLDPIGIVKHKEQSWIKRPDTKGVHISAMLEDPATGQIIYGTYNDGIHWSDKILLPGKSISDLSFGPGNALFAGTHKDGLIRIDKNKHERIIPRGPGYMAVYNLLISGDSLLIGTHFGLIIGHGIDRPRLYSTNSATNRAARATAIVNDTVYYGGEVSGVLKIAGGKVLPAVPEAFRSSTVYGIQKMPDGRYVAFGEFHHLLVFDKDFQYEHAIDLREFTANVMAAEFIDNSRLIIASQDGLFQVRLEGTTVTAVRKYGKIDGYNDDEPYVGASLRTSDGSILIGTVDGAYEFVEENDAQDPTATNAYITRATFATAASDSVQGFFRLPVNPVLAYDENHITFSFGSTNLSNPYNTRFRHRMEGLLDEWSPVTSSNMISYSNLPPGDYVFCVQAISDASTWGSIERYAFSVEPAIWQTTTFYVMAAIIIGLCVVGIIHGATRRRLQQFKVKEQVRADESRRLKKQMSMDFHDEMGNRLANMLTQASVLKLQHPETKLFQAFDFFERHAHAIYHGTKDFIWTIDVDSNNLYEVIIYLRDFGAGYFERNEIAFHVEQEISPEHHSFVLPDGANRQIILIIKEAMTNVLKHAHASHVYFSVILDGSWLTISVRDNGKGFAAKNNGRGLENMRARANKLAGRLRIASGEDNGTVIALSVFMREQ